MRSFAVSLLATASLVLASPVKQARDAEMRYGALATPAPAAQNDIDPGPEYLTISIINSHTAPISTSQASNPGAPTPVSGYTGAGTIAASATTAFVVPTGWAGAVSINDYGYELTGDDSQIQANYVVPSNYDFAVADVDVSYVSGFSVAIVCSCGGAVVSGCNLDLYGYGSCPDGDRDLENGCINPNRNNGTATEATPFFAPCQGAAYTFPNDSGANSLGQCQSGTITCCVGNTCPTNPKQPVQPTSSASA